MVVPDRSTTERAEALNHALEARRRRAAVKAALKSKELDLIDVFEMAEEDPVLMRTRVVDLLCSLPRVGPKTALRIMTQADISESRRVQGLGIRQREELVSIVGSTKHSGTKKSKKKAK